MSWLPKPAPELLAQGVTVSASAEGFSLVVPSGVKAVFHLGSELGRPAKERSRIVLGEGAELDFVEGCSAAQGGAEKRCAFLQAEVGRNAVLRGASVQSWPASCDYEAEKALRVYGGGRVTWLDANLGARRARKRLKFDLLPGASAEVVLAGFAAGGQDHSWEVEGGAAVRGWAAARGAGRISGPEGLRFWTVEDLTARQRLYLASRGLEGAAAEAAAVHAFLEPFARLLPLEFSVEFTRLLDAELTQVPGT